MLLLPTSLLSAVRTHLPSTTVVTANAVATTTATAATTATANELAEREVANASHVEGA